MALEFSLLKARANSGLLRAAVIASCTVVELALNIEDNTKVVAGDLGVADRITANAFAPEAASI